MKKCNLLIMSILVAIVLIPVESIAHHHGGSGFAISFSTGPGIRYYQDRTPYYYNYGYGYPDNYPVIIEKRYYNDNYPYYRSYNNFYNFGRGDRGWHHGHWR